MSGGRIKSKKIQKPFIGLLLYISFNHPKILQYGLKIMMAIMDIVAFIGGMTSINGFWKETDGVASKKGTKEHKHIKK